MVITCIQCEKEIITSPSRINKRYCSKECYSIYVKKHGLNKGALNGSYKGGLQGKVCLFCKNNYLVSYSHHLKSKYCSKLCADKDRIGKNVSPEQIKKMKQTIALKPKKIETNFCSICSKKIKASSQYCQQHKHFTQGYINARKKQSNTTRGIMPKNIMVAGAYGNIKRGWYDINGKNMFFRSMWEVNYAFYLDFLVKAKQIQSWEYEKDVFIFDKIISGTRTYRPDFKIFNNDDTFEYHEVKGRMDSKSLTKLKRMKKYYPEIKMVLIDRPVYEGLKRSLGKVMPY